MNGIVLVNILEIVQICIKRQLGQIEKKKYKNVVLLREGI